ncbi:MAG: lyase family protein, partial [Candidatus Omnitrophica bacterium]|nr:lyase family protein [Candidatus Omnitrophota bacterium]
LFAFEEGMFERDIDRLERFYTKLCIFIGAGALTGCTIEKKNYNEAIKELSGIKESSKIKPVKNALDNVSDRDFIIEFLSIISIIQMHLSRLSEDFILYSTKEFDFIELPEEFCTGSSLMPHKKNPDFLELVRGNTGKIYGNLMSVLTTMKGLPLTYNRDMQLDKEPLFSSVETILDELKIMSKFLKKIELHDTRIDNILTQDISLYATEIAQYLVEKKGLPFKKAHDITGKFIILLERNRGKTNEIDDRELKKTCAGLTKAEIVKVVNPEYALSLRKDYTKNFLKRKK